MTAAQVRALFHGQAADCLAMGSPFTARLLTHLAHLLDDRTEIGRAVLTTVATRADALPLRLAGGLHALARRGVADVAALYPPSSPSDADFARGLANVLAGHGPDLMPWLASAPQTNEVARSAVLIAAGHWLTARYGLPLHLSELGASAGLNLLWDHYALSLPAARLGPEGAALTLSPEWTGPVPIPQPVQVVHRAGVDLSPLDPLRDRDRMLAYIWADQTARLARAEAALTLAARLRPLVTKADAGDWAAVQLSRNRPGALHLVYHTIAAQYFPPATRAKLSAALTAAGAAATPEAPLAHLSMEADALPDGAALTLTLWPGARTIPLGRADFHGRWLRWTAPQP